MRIIPVLDIRRRRAVRAVAGDRDHYAPLVSVLHPGTDPVQLARAARDTWGLPDLYLADLDAILGEAPASLGIFEAIADLGVNLWVDAGVRRAADAGPLIEARVGRIVVGLETIQGPERLAEVLAEVGADAVVFSLDLFQGRPMIDTRSTWGTDRPEEIAARAVDQGVRRLIHLDLARVGRNRGVATPAMNPAAGVDWVIGGGIRGVEEIESLGRAGYSGVLVGSALHDGRIGAADLARFTGSGGSDPGLDPPDWI